MDGAPAACVLRSRAVKRDLATTRTAPIPTPGATQGTRRYLVVLHPEPGSPIPVEGRTVVGRGGRRTDLALDDDLLSRAHFEVKPATSADVYRLRDLGSKNGTLVDGRRVEEAFLCDGSIIRAGQTLLVFVERVPPIDAPAVPARRSTALTWAEAEADRVAASPLPVLVRGPTGAGKELIAQRIHAASGRAGPLVPVNCAAIAPELLHSELFGHVRGAFSGSASDRDGLFRAAHGGTLFLDEIAELPTEQQPALLRVLQEGRVRPLGSDREVTVDVRVVAATHEDLQVRVDQGRFRLDLLARVAGATIDLPGLATRRGDILPLFREFLGVDVELTADVAEMLLVYDWPRNIRELQHVAERVRPFAQGDVSLPAAALPAEVQRAVRATSTANEGPDREALERLLETHEGNVARVARALGLSRQRVYRQLEALTIDPAAYR